MERKKIIILGVVLTVFALLYVVALGIGMSRSDGRYSAGEQKNGIAGSIGDLLGGFAPKVDVSGLECRYGQSRQSVATSFKLTEQQPTCEINIPRAVGDPPPSYRKASLRIFRGDEPISVYIGYDEPEGDLPLNIPCERYNTLNGKVRLEVEYRPRDNKDDASVSKADLCWKEADDSDTVGFTVMKDGGFLKLTCTGCARQPRRFVTMRLE